MKQFHPLSIAAPQGEGKPMPYSMNEMETYIRQAAQQRGIDPEIALRVAKSEGLQPGTWQSNVVKKGVREPSYGPFQLYTGGGLGNDFQKATGLDPADPATAYQGVDFALDKAAKGGWGPWYGAKAANIAPMQGIPAMPQTAAAQPPQGSMPSIPGMPPPGMIGQGLAAAQAMPGMLDKLKDFKVPSAGELDLARLLPASMTGVDGLKNIASQGIEGLQNMFRTPSMPTSVPPISAMASAGLGAGGAASVAPSQEAVPLSKRLGKGIFGAMAGLAQMGQPNQQAQQQQQAANADAEQKRMAWWLAKKQGLA